MWKKYLNTESGQVMGASGALEARDWPVNHSIVGTIGIIGGIKEEARQEAIDGARALKEASHDSSSLSAFTKGTRAH